MTAAQLEEWRQDPRLATWLDRPTPGALRRQQGLPDDQMCDEARIAFAYEIASELLRRAIIDKLDSLLAGKIRDPERIAARFRAVADLLDPPDRPADSEAA